MTYDDLISTPTPNRTQYKSIYCITYIPTLCFNMMSTRLALIRFAKRVGRNYLTGDMPCIGVVESERLYKVDPLKLFCSI